MRPRQRPPLVPIRRLRDGLRWMATTGGYWPGVDPVMIAPWVVVALVRLGWCACDKHACAITPRGERAAHLMAATTKGRPFAAALRGAA